MNSDIERLYARLPHAGAMRLIEEVLPEDGDGADRQEEADRSERDEAFLQHGLIEENQFHIHHRAVGEKCEFRAP